MPAQNPYFGVVFGMQTAIAPWPSQGSFAQSGIIWHSISIAKMPLEGMSSYEPMAFEQD